MTDLKSIIVHQSLNSEDNLQIAYETIDSWRDIQIAVGQRFISSLMNKLKDRLVKEIPNLSNKWQINDGESDEIFLCLRITNPDWKNDFDFGIYNEAGSDGLYFWIDSYNEKLKKEITDKMKVILNEGIVNDKEWWTYAKEPYKKWENNIKSLIEFSFPQQNPNALNYFLSKLLQLAITIEEIRNEI